MPRARLIKPEFYDDEKLSRISRDARLVFPALWIFSDDYGVVKGNHEWLLSKIFPYERDIKISQFSCWLAELEVIDCIRPFSVDGESYYYISHFKDHQTINKPSQTRNPTPPDIVIHQCNTTTVVLPSEVEIEREVEEKKEVEVKEKLTSAHSKKINGQGFDDFWEAYPRKAGKLSAKKSFEKVSKLKTFPGIEAVLMAINKQKTWQQWATDNGKFIPYPATWLNQERWNDEQPESTGINQRTFTNMKNAWEVTNEI